MSHRKSRTSLIFRLAGDLPAADEVTRLLGVAPTRQRRKGELVHLGRHQPFDVWILNLIEINRESETHDLFGEFVRVFALQRQALEHRPTNRFGRDIVCRG